jgi:transcriptional regulator with XRE-family HTH domain
MTFAEKLRELRDARELSEAKLADASGLPFATVHNYALGRRKPSLAAALKLAKALGVPCEAFADCDDVQGDEEQPSPPAAKAKGKAGKDAGGEQAGAKKGKGKAK